MRASLVREAVSSYRAQVAGSTKKDSLGAGFGLWKNRTDIGDAVAWQRRERALGTRPWDDDYVDVKAEVPDLFDAEDDRQRQNDLDMLDGKYPEPKVPGSA